MTWILLGFNPQYRSSDPQTYVEGKLIPDLHAIVEQYKPEMLLMDGEWEHNSTFWQTRPFLQWLFNESPVKDHIVVDDRWGSECRGHHGGVYVCENGGFSDFCDGTGGGANATAHDWFYWATQARSWGLSMTEDDTDYKGPDFFVPLLVKSVADNGGLMLNLGPAADGRIPAIQESILRGVGKWLAVNGPAIYNTTARKGVRREIVQTGPDFAPTLPGQNAVCVQTSVPHVYHLPIAKLARGGKPTTCRTTQN